MSKFTLEVCADSVESVLAAEKGGADQDRALRKCGDWRNNSIRESFPRDPQA